MHSIVVSLNNCSLIWAYPRDNKVDRSCQSLFFQPFHGPFKGIFLLCDLIEQPISWYGVLSQDLNQVITKASFMPDIDLYRERSFFMY